MSCCRGRLDALVCVSLCPVKDAFTRALSHLPIPQRWQPTLGGENLPQFPLHPGSNQNFIAPHSSFTQEQSKVKATALRNQLWSLILTLPDARANTFQLQSIKENKWHHEQEPGSQESRAKNTEFSLSLRQANADSIHYLAMAEEEAAASCVRYSRRSFAAWKRP